MGHSNHTKQIRVHAPLASGWVEKMSRKPDSTANTSLPVFIRGSTDRKGHGTYFCVYMDTPIPCGQFALALYGEQISASCGRAGRPFGRDATDCALALFMEDRAWEASQSVPG